MNRLKTPVLAIVALLFSAPMLRAQLSKVVVVDFERAVVESDEGKKASDKFNGILQAKQGEVEKKQKELDDQQKKLQTGARTLSDQAKADIQRDIDRRTTELQRLNEDAQRELQSSRDELLKPIAERASAVLGVMAEQENYTLVIDISNPESNVVWKNPKNDITDELIKRINASSAATGKTEAPKTPAPATPAPSGAKPPQTAAPKPATPPAPTTPKP
jgi:outer membrane protein